MFSEQTIYIRVEKDLFNFLHVQSGRVAKIQGAFSNQRLAIANFRVAAEALKKGAYEVYPKSFIRISPVIVMHQIFNSEGGLCEIEERILREAAISAGAKQIFIWQGQLLSSSQLIDRVYKNA